MWLFVGFFVVLNSVELGEVSIIDFESNGRVVLCDVDFVNFIGWFGIYFLIVLFYSYLFVFFLDWFDR